MNLNRSFRSQESQLLKRRQQQEMQEKEEELALFFEMRRHEKERENGGLLMNNSEEFDVPLGSKPGTSPIFNITSSAPARKTAADDFLNSDNDKNDYDWLLTPPGTPLFPSLDMDSQKTVMSQIGTPKARPTALKSRLANPEQEPASKNNVVSKSLGSSPGMSSGGTRRPSSSGGPGSRPTTPSGRPMPSTASKASRPSTPTSRATLSSSKPVGSVPKSTISAARSTTSTSKPAHVAARSTVPATRSTASTPKPATLTSKSTVPGRSSTPSRSTPRSTTPSRSTARSSTPTSRPAVPPSKSTSRAATPTRRPSTPSRAPNVATPVKSSSSQAKPSLTSTKSSVPSRGTSPTPTVKSRPWKPSEMPGFSLDAPPNLRTSLADRPLSATRGRPGAPSPRSSSVEPGSVARARRQSCSPSRGRLANGMHPSGSSVPAVNRHSKVNDNVSPVMIGTKMVERVINMRKLVPPKPDDKLSPNVPGKGASPDSTGFGRTLSKKSLDMAIRHMDIRRSIPGNLRPLMTNIPASSMYSVRSGPSKSRMISVSDSPLATSSNASSEVSVNNNGICVDRNEVDDDNGSERGGHSSPASVHGR